MISQTTFGKFKNEEFFLQEIPTYVENSFWNLVFTQFGTLGRNFLPLQKLLCTKNQGSSFPMSGFTAKDI